jgi:hypothetical protein
LRIKAWVHFATRGKTPRHKKYAADCKSSKSSNQAAAAPIATSASPSSGKILEYSEGTVVAIIRSLPMTAHERRKIRFRFMGCMASNGESHMDMISKNIIRSLLDKREETCVSMYMPTRGSGGGAQQNMIRFKNLLRRAEEFLDAGGIHQQKAGRLLDPARKLLEDHTFWLHQSSGLAMFIAHDTLLFWRFPISFEEIAVVSDRFYLKPLLPLLNQGGQFYILGLSRDGVRLFHATRTSMTEIDVSDINETASAALRSGGTEKTLRFHAAASGSAGRRAVVVHGSGPGNGGSKENLLRFFRLVDRRAGEIIRDRHMPMILACVNELFPLYRTVNTRPNLLDEFIHGSPDSISEEALHGRALEILEAYMRREQAEVVEQCVQAEAAGHASTDLRKIVEAANQGRIEMLVVADGQQQWGTVDPVTGEVHVHKKPQPVDEDLLDFAAMHALLSGAAVYSVEPGRLPDRKPAAALLRY